MDFPSCRGFLSTLVPLGTPGTGRAGEEGEGRGGRAGSAGRGRSREVSSFEAAKKIGIFRGF